MVLGVTSANIKIINVKTTVVIIGDGTPNIEIAIEVAMVAARIFTKLFPISITPINLSGDSSSLLERMAPA